MELSHIRKDFGLHRLIESEMPGDPISFLKTWLKEVSLKEVPDFNAMVLSTVGKNNKPSSRIVLLKEITEKGQLVFFTNYDSRKGNEISGNKQVALNFFWPVMERQVRVEGTVSKVSREQSKAYFDSRPLESRISAILSPQSKEIESLDEFRSKAKEMLQIQRDLKIPENWGGYSVSPEFYEFWQGGRDRLHDRITYTLKNSDWKMARLAP
ncbi:MAG TPA: pyridoxamine 5'-phosphate oxidase [Bacteroidales bacterium]